EILNKVETLDPFTKAKNPIRCLFFHQNDYFWRGYYNWKDGTDVRVELGSYLLRLYEDFYCQPTESYNESAVKKYLQSLHNQYNDGMHIYTAITIRLENKFPNFLWNCLMIEEDVNGYGIVTRPPNLPIFEARGPNGERIFVWALSKRKMIEKIK